MTKYKFKENISGASDGRNVVEYTQGDVIEASKLSKYLANAWLERGIIEEIKEGDEKVEATENATINETKTETETEAQEAGEGEGETKTDEETQEGETATETEAGEDTTAQTGDEAVDAFLNGETNKTPEGTEEISEEETEKLQIKALIEEANECLKAEQVDTDKLKEIGIKLNIKNMSKTVNPDTIIDKIKKFLEETETEAQEAGEG